MKCVETQYFHLDMKDEYGVEVQSPISNGLGLVKLIKIFSVSKSKIKMIILGMLLEEDGNYIHMKCGVALICNKWVVTSGFDYLLN